jgi:MSHA biogenesis protein MshJ
MKLRTVQIQEGWSLLLRHWRRVKRAHAARSESERRLIVLGIVALTWFLIDAVFFTPSLTRVQEAHARLVKVKTELASKSAESARYTHDIKLMTQQLQGDVDKLRQRVAAQQEEIDSFQNGLVPARDLRKVLQAMLADTAGLSLVSMKTLGPEEAAKVLPPAQEVPGMYRHAMELRISGGFSDLHDWLLSVEGMPRKLLWSGMQLELDEEQRLFLSVRVVTLSPDTVPLEIAE